MRSWLGKDAAGRNASRWFARLRSGAVSESTDREFGQWLNLDSRNENEFERCELLWELLGEVQDDPEVLRLAQRTSSPARLQQPRPSPWLKWGLAAAALCALAVTGYWQLTTHSRPAESPIQEMVVTTGIGEQKQLVLRDGSRVFLNTATRLHERFTDRVRWLDLERGEAVFLVRHDARWPFVVAAGKTGTRAIGTAFDVLHLPGRTDIAVITGRVQVDASSAGKTSQQIALNAGHAAAYSDAHGLGPVSTANLWRITAWQRHRVEFHDDTLTAAVNDFNRYITRPIVIGDPSLAGIRVSGVFRCDDAAAFVRALSDTFGIRSETRGTAVVLLPRVVKRRASPGGSAGATRVGYHRGYPP